MTMSTTPLATPPQTRVLLDEHTLAEHLNLDCQCVSLDSALLRKELGHTPEGAALLDMIAHDRPHLFAGSTVFVSVRNLERMAALITAIETVVALPGYIDHVLASAPEAAKHVPKARGVFLGYDFHLPTHAEGWPQLIEINTNAGGGLLNALLARAHRACCENVGVALPGLVEGDDPEQLFMEMFRAEWRAERGENAVLRHIAIVDDAPEQQYLYPEFLLFRRLFERHGIKASIADPRDLTWRDNALWLAGQRVDLVYNRLTDFALDAPENAALRAAWLAQGGKVEAGAESAAEVETDRGTVITPHPYAHAVYADKRNLVALCDDAALRTWGVSAEVRATLAAGIPRTERVEAARANDLWARRRQLFFKPAGGYGARAAYRGDKLTRRVFDEILSGEVAYVAQALAPPSFRQVHVAGDAAPLKLDLRNYVYDGRVQLVAARLWQGQTTNFRTPGGGFAPVMTVVRDPSERAGHDNL